MKRLIIFTILCLFSITLNAQEENITGEEILRKIDENEYYDTIEYTGQMIIHIDDQIRTKQLTSQARSEGHKALVEFTNPEDYGTKYLLIDDELWIYFPIEEEVVRSRGTC